MSVDIILLGAFNPGPHVVNGVLLAVLATATVFLGRDGLWTSAIALLNVLCAATLATAWYEFLVRRVEPLMPSYDFVLDFLCIWALFCAILAVLREATDRVSRTRVRFGHWPDLVGGWLVALLAGWVFTCFTAASLHVAPVPRDFVQPTPNKRMLFGLAPDRRWLQWVRGGSLGGPFARPKHAFDPDADFILRYADRRLKLEANPALRVRSK